MERVIAHVDFTDKEKVGKYGVDVSAIDEASDNLLSLSDKVDIYLVDEIGKMECMSSKFISTIRTLIESEKPLVITIDQRGEGFIQVVKQLPQVEILELSHKNRNDISNYIVQWLRELGTVK